MSSMGMKKIHIRKTVDLIDDAAEAKRGEKGEEKTEL